MGKQVKLKACPFCGELEWFTPMRRNRENWVYAEEDEWWVVCPWCQTNGPMAGSIGAAVRKWNQRR